jgi:phenylalanyl-tRNA synthetase beta chain
MLVIADGRRPVALAGIMGGAGSEISDSTRCVLLESACFDPALIHRTSLALGLATESSYRFERGVDVGAVEWAGRRAAALIAQVASARVLPGVVDAWPAPRPERTVAFRHERARRLLGMAITDEEAAGIFERLGMKVGGKAAGSCVVTVPSFRGDIEIEADLIEEVARIHGLAGIPSAIVKPVLVAGADDSFERSVAACRGAAAALGFSEIVNYSFISAGLANLFGGSGEGGRVDLPNPVSADYSVMRGSLVPQMVETMGRNVSRQVMDLAFFEMGRVFRGAGNRVCEDDRICLGLTGKGGRSNGDMRTPVSPEEAFLWIKGAVESLSAALKAGDFRFVVRDAPWAEPGWCAGVEVEGAAIGVVGLVSRDIRHRWRLSEPVAVAELPVSPLVSNLFSPRPLKPVPVFPGVARDVAVVAPDSMRHERIVEVMRAAAPSELTDIRLFDTFRSESLGLGKRSLAYTLVYRSAERTLTDEEANAFHDTVKGALREELKVEIREN